MNELKNEIGKFDFDDYEIKRSKYENDNYVCSLIRNDSIDEFIVFISRTNLRIDSQIPPSIFETNQFLINKKPKLIEYATFFGSTQIFKYLVINEVELSSSLWLYAIHSKNAEMIQILEEKQIQPADESFIECYIESIKCHHNDIAEYIEMNYLNQDDESESQFKFEDKVISCSFKYYNYSFFPVIFYEILDFII